MRFQNLHYDAAIQLRPTEVFHLLTFHLSAQLSITPQRLGKDDLSMRATWAAAVI